MGSGEHQIPIAVIVSTFLASFLILTVLLSAILVKVKTTVNRRQGINQCYLLW